MANQSLRPIEQKQVLLYDDELTAVRVQGGDVYVALNQMCSSLGLDTQGQRQRISRHEILAEGVGVCKLHTPGGFQETAVLRVDLVPLWLSGIRIKSVKEAIRPKLTQFQREAAKVLWQAFQDGKLTTTPDIEELLNTESPAAQAYKMAMAMAALARNQLLLEVRLEARLDDHNNRLERLEAARLGSKNQISEDQAMQVSQAVKTVALALGKRSKRNEFGAVYGELYRKFGITSYKMLPTKRFEEAMNFLTEWHQNLVGDVPF